MNSRLPTPFGSQLNRSQPINFTFEGATYWAFAGDSVASALVANNVWVFTRSFKYHRPRGPMSFACCEANTLVTVNGVPNVFADQHLIQNGDIVIGQNYVGSLLNDTMWWLQSISRYMKVGFYYRAFYRPRGAWHFWEPIIRKMAGLGRVHEGAPHRYFDKAYLFADVVVVGGGSSGLAAGLHAAGLGKSVVLVEQAHWLGGSRAYIRPQSAEADAKRKASLPSLAQTNCNIMILSDASCEGLFSDLWLSVVQKRRLYKIRAQEIILATGCIELPAVFRGNDLPGIVTGTAAQRLIRLYAISPSQNAVVLAGNRSGYEVALDLKDAGTNVTIVDMRTHGEPDPIANEVTLRNIRVLQNTVIHEATGWHHVEAVKVGAPDQIAALEQIKCDLVCMCVGAAPNLALAAHAGASIEYDSKSAQYVVKEIPRGISIVGKAEGGKSENYLYPITRHKKGKEFVDFDEDITIDDIEDTIATGFDHVQLLKRYSTLGMGPSQGRHSNINAIRISAKIRDVDGASIGTTTFRPPYCGESFGVLAGRSFEPVRRTSMHHLHGLLGARMMIAGSWLRPAFYGKVDAAERAIGAEVAAVRQGVGVIDVSTLGKIEVRGPQAAELINRLYVTGHLKQAVGKVRYALMTDAMGCVVDDGVVAKLDETHFFVTATTTGVENVLRAMYFWNAHWQLDADITNVTTSFCAVNIAGPDSRKLLSDLGADFPLSAQDFPYMSAKIGRVSNILSYVMRVGFVGELGYEVHVPSSLGYTFWQTVCAKGKPYDLVPFGVEAQRILRLEKGHVIVGQDTDGLTNPIEIGMAPAPSKTFFIGSAAIAAQKERRPQRKLVGFRTEGLPDASIKECHLVIEDGQIAGRVTSCAKSVSQQDVFGLAYVLPHQAEVGTTLQIRADLGSMVAARVVSLPFYDPNNERQSL